jgi:hypothetical protein
MDLAGGWAVRFAGAVTVADDDRSGRADGNPHPRRIDCRKLGLLARGALGLDRLTIPSVEAKDAIGLGDGKPSLDVGELLAGADARADRAERDGATERTDLLVGKTHHFTLTLRTGSGLGCAPATATPS